MAAEFRFFGLRSFTWRQATPGRPWSATSITSALAVDDFPRLADFAHKEGIDLTIVGPEAPLVDGFADYFKEQGLRCFGPSRAAARLEGSKAFAKGFLQRHGIPTAASVTFTDLVAAKAHVHRHGLPIVIKADGLAAGKGVVAAHSLKEAEAALTAMLSGDAFGDAGRKVVVEEFLEGEESSFIALCDGRHGPALGQFPRPQGGV